MDVSRGSFTNSIIIFFNVIIFLITVLTANMFYIVLKFDGVEVIYGASPTEVFLGRAERNLPDRIPISWLQFYLSQINFFVLNHFYIWQLLTSMFIHFGIIHLTFNMLALYFLGNVVEMSFGRKKFLLIFIISGLAGNIASLFLLKYLPFIGSARFVDLTPSAGASGAIFGLLGAIASLGRRNGNLFSSIVFVVLIFLINSFLPGVNLFAHLFGLLAGFITGYVLLKFMPKQIEVEHL